MPLAVGIAEHEPLCRILRTEDVHERRVRAAANRTAAIRIHRDGLVANCLTQPGNRLVLCCDIRIGHGADVNRVSEDVSKKRPPWLSHTGEDACLQHL